MFSSQQGTITATTMGLATLTTIGVGVALLAAWDARLRFRWDLARKAAETPHLIDDIGLTRDAVETEIAKPSWRV